jgi:hypothetical protein
MTREALSDQRAVPRVEAPGSSTSLPIGGAQARRASIAVIVCHGMGEQVPFETLNAVAEALWSRQSDAPMDASNARVRYVAFGEEWLPRVELTLRHRAADAGSGDGHGADAGGRFDAHLYEVYWAPLTEGKVTARDAIAFLLGAGARGIRYCVRGSFDRWIFGRRVTFRLPRRGALQLGVALGAFVALLAAFIGVAAATVAELVRFLHSGPLPPPPWWLSSVPDAWMLGGLACALLVFAALRWFLVQSVGDVAAYISAHRASRFAEIRREIQDAARRVARNVYAARDESGAPSYAHVLLVGHSLGSVIAYDMLNDSINRDLASRAAQGMALDVARRTKLLLTLGSPLDKTAFLFRTQKDHAPLREALAAAAQPMIVDYANRPARWINIWSPFDWICGSLEYYDLARETGGARAGAGAQREGGARRGAVENVRERGVPLDTVRAHLGYWRRPTFGKRLYAAMAEAARGGLA